MRWYSYSVKSTGSGTWPVIYTTYWWLRGKVVKNLPASAGDAGDPGSILGSRRSPEEGNGNPPQYSYLGSPMDRGASVSSVQFSCSVMSDSSAPWTAARQACPSPTPELAQTHVHRVSDAIQASYPLSSPSPPALNLSQHQDLSQGVSSLHKVAKVLEFQLQHQSFQ